MNLEYSVPYITPLLRVIASSRTQYIHPGTEKVNLHPAMMQLIFLLNTSSFIHAFARISIGEENTMLLN